MTARTPIDDPAVVVPAAVRAASARASQLHANVYKSAAPVVAPAAAPVAPVVAQEAPAAPVVAQEAPAAPVTHEGKPVDWEARYRAAQGRVDASNRQINSLSTQNASLQAQMESLASRPATLPPELDPRSLLTPREEEEYGTEFLDVVGRRARSEIIPEVDILKKQVEDLQTKLSGVTGVVHATTQVSFESEMTKALPNWTTINQNPEFLTWLGLPDHYSGVIRHSMLKNAYTQKDVSRVLAFFNGFLAELAAVAPPAPTIDPAQDTGLSLEDLAAPGRAKAAAATGPSEKPFFTRAQITQFYTDSAAGKFRGREAEYNATEKKLQSALREGRIR